MMPVARFRFTDAFYAEAFQRHQQAFPGTPNLRLLRGGLALLLTLGVIVVVQSGDISTVWRLAQPMVVIVLGLLLFFYLFGHRLERWAACRGFRKSPFHDELLRVEFRQDGVHAVGEVASVSASWGTFAKVVHFRDGFLIVEHGGLYRWIPIRYLEDPASLNELETLLRDNIRDHRVIEPVRVETPKDEWG
jgi:hypothetical protein